VPVILPQAPVTDMPFLEGTRATNCASVCGTVHAPKKEFELPDLSLLDYHPPVRQDINNEALQESARVLSEKLKDFRIDGEVTGIHPGPVITLFEFRPGRGIKVAQIASFEGLAMALSAEQVRVIAPIPGRDVVGIEIPNRVRETVYLRD
jgi:S-DNA-T family DNA segregation ATPase FtsK/SpoIIIE